MAIQRWTILSIVGVGVPPLTHLLHHFASLRTSTDPDLVAHDEWPLPVRRRTGSLIAALHRHRAHPSIAYYAQHMDSWSVGNRLHLILPPHRSSPPASVSNDGAELHLYPLPDRGKLLRRARSIAKNPQFPEDAWLASSLAHAATAHHHLWKSALLLIIREVTGGRFDDPYRLAATSTPPPWLRNRR